MLLEILEVSRNSLRILSGISPEFLQHFSWNFSWDCFINSIRLFVSLRMLQKFIRKCLQRLFYYPPWALSEDSPGKSERTPMKISPEMPSSILSVFRYRYLSEIPLEIPWDVYLGIIYAQISPAIHPATFSYDSSNNSSAYFAKNRLVIPPDASSGFLLSLLFMRIFYGNSNWSPFQNFSKGSSIRSDISPKIFSTIPSDLFFSRTSTRTFARDASSNSSTFSP